MKKFTLTLGTVCLIAMSLTACPSPNNSGSSATPSSSTSPSPSSGTGTNLSGNLSSKAAFIAYLNCAKEKNPSLATGLDIRIAAINNISDSDWASRVAKGEFNSQADAYKQFGCS